MNNMMEIKCPKCGTMFTVDKADYADIVSQVKNQEFAAEVAKREEELRAQYATREQLAKQQAEMQLQQSLAAKTSEIEKQNSLLAELRAKLQGIEQVKNSERQAAILAEQNRLQDSLNSKDVEIANLKAAMQQMATKQEAEAKLAESQVSEQINTMRIQYEAQIKSAQDEIERLKDFKVRLSTKMVGETLEQHCYNEFTRVSPLFPNAEFHKDNEAVVGDDGRGTKGDFIFRDKSDDGVEYISIMFEMKNENDDTATKHKNQDFFHKLDEDRKKKHCEYAVLVSMLEPDNDLYNNGIVSVLQNDKGEKFDKMYVIRPQFFVPLITLLCQTSRKTLDTRRELELMKSQQVDVTNFEQKLVGFQETFGKHVLSAHKNYEAAIKAIDASIKSLESVKKALTTSANQLRLANNDAMDLSIRKLTWGNATMKKLFEEAQNVTDEE